MSADPLFDLACAEQAAILDRAVFLDRPTSLDELDITQRMVTASIAAERLGRSTRTVQRWAATGRLIPVACLVDGHVDIYREVDILRAERDARLARQQGRPRVSA